MWDGGREPPSPFFEQPEIMPELQEYWSAFHDLSTERYVGMGIGPIPFFKAREYATDELELIGEARDRFLEIIRQLDSDYLRLVNETQISKSKGKGRKTAQKDPAQEISVMDVASQREMFKGLRERAAQRKRNGK